MKISFISILTVIVLFIPLSIIAQQKTVIVGYGETFETIAHKYGVSIGDLRAANPGKDNCYAGMEIEIPYPEKSPVGASEITSAVLLRADSLLVKAKDYNRSGSYNKAIKLYNQVLGMKVRTPYALSGRGESYFNLKKYKKAEKDLLQAINSNQLARQEKIWCEEALEDVENEIQAKRERRSEIWSKIGLTVATAAAVTATAYMASEQNKMQRQYYGNTMPVSTSEGSGGMSRVNQIIAQSDAKLNQMSVERNIQLNQMTVSMLNQAEQQRQRLQEAMVEQLKWCGEYEREHGYQPTELEIIQWYKANYPDLADSYIQSLAMKYEASHSEEKESESEYMDSSSPSNYQEQYKRLEHLAEMWYRNLTTGGVRYEDRNGNIKGITSRDMAHVGGAYVGNQKGLKEAQKKMRAIRLEAEKHGVHIVESKWETASSNF